MSGEKDDFEPLAPSAAMQIVSLLEDAGLVKIADAGWTFDHATKGPSFILPDEIIWLLVFASIAYSATLMRWI